MPDNEYRLVNSGAGADEFRQVMALAATQGRLPIALKASRWVTEELEREPHQFGESRYHLPAADLTIRVGFARPLYVEFGIHDPSRQVFLRKFRLVR